MTDHWCSPTFTLNALLSHSDYSNYCLWTIIHCHDCIHQPFLHSCIPQSPSSDLSRYSIKCFFQNYESKVQFLSFTLIFLLHPSYGEDCTGSSFPWHKSKLHIIDLCFIFDPSYRYMFCHFHCMAQKLYCCVWSTLANNFVGLENIIYQHRRCERLTSIVVQVHQHFWEIIVHLCRMMSHDSASLGKCDVWGADVAGMQSMQSSAGESSSSRGVSRCAVVRPQRTGHGWLHWCTLLELHLLTRQWIRSLRLVDCSSTMTIFFVVTKLTTQSLMLTCQWRKFLHLGKTQDLDRTPRPRHQVTIPRPRHENLSRECLEARHGLLRD